MVCRRGLAGGRAGWLAWARGMALWKCHGIYMGLANISNRTRFFLFGLL